MIPNASFVFSQEVTQLVVLAAQMEGAIYRSEEYSTTYLHILDLPTSRNNSQGNRQITQHATLAAYPGSKSWDVFLASTRQSPPPTPTSQGLRMFYLCHLRTFYGQVWLRPSIASKQLLLLPSSDTACQGEVVKMTMSF